MRRPMILGVPERLRAAANVATGIIFPKVICSIP